MNEHDIDTHAEPGLDPVVSGPGQRLRLARERRNLSIREVAERLHISERQVTALENDDDSALPGAVFAQGYLRKYARLVDEPPEEIVRSYASQRPVAEYKPSVRQFEIKMKMRQVTSSHGLVKAITWLLILGLAVLLVVWWRGYITLPVLGEETGSVPTSEWAWESSPVLPARGNGDQDAAVPRSAGADTAPAVDAAGSVEPLSGQVEATAESSRPAAESAPRTEERVSEPVLASVSAAARIEERPPSEAPAVDKTEEPDAVADDAHAVVLEFDSPCWVDVRDSAGQKVLYGGIGKGETHRLGGKPPYQIVLGNSEAVRIMVGRKPFDVAAHSRGQVARFALDPFKSMVASGEANP